MRPFALSLPLLAAALLGASAPVAAQAAAPAPSLAQDPDAPRAGPPLVGHVGADRLESLARGRDFVVRRLGDRELTASDVYRVLDLAYPGLVEDTLGEMMVTLGVHLEAEREGVDVPAEALDAEVRRAMARQKLEFSQSVGEGFTLEEYLAERHGMTEVDWRREAERMVLASMLRDRVVRLQAWRKPRDELQVILVTDEALAEEIAGKLRDGASFSALAKQHSLHPSKDEGGLMPPLAQGLDVPLVAGRERLAPGEWLGPAPYSIQTADYFRFVRLVDQLPAETAPWRELRARIEASLEERAVGQDEVVGFEGELRGRYGVSAPAEAAGADAASDAATPGSSPNG